MPPSVKVMFPPSASRIISPGVSKVMFPVEVPIVTAASPVVISVSYTHLTLPTNREV